MPQERHCPVDPLNIAIYGGSFDPPTLGHLMVVTHLLLNDSTVNAVYVIPCFQQRGKNLVDFDQRMEMCERQFGHLPRTKVLPIERELGGESLTVRLIRELAKREPNACFRFVMGADLLESCHRWEGWDEIERLAPPLVIGRAGISPRGPGDPTPISPVVSSTIVKEALGRGAYREAERYLAVPVTRYIEDLRLYLKPSLLHPEGGPQPNV
jgi:nicotinate-nucleotide adenylyltransferase